jgi:hypothetical protein
VADLGLDTELWDNGTCREEVNVSGDDRGADPERR